MNSLDFAELTISLARSSSVNEDARVRAERLNTTKAKVRNIFAGELYMRCELKAQTFRKKERLSGLMSNDEHIFCMKVRCGSRAQRMLPTIAPPLFGRSSCGSSCT